MACTDSKINAGLAFSIMSQLYFVAIFLLLLLRHYDMPVVPHHALSNAIVVGFPVLVVFAIIALAAPGDCFERLFDDFLDIGRRMSRASHALEWGILSLLLSIIIAIILTTKVMGRKEPLFERAEKLADPPLPYTQPAQQVPQQPVPQPMQQPPAQPHYAPPTQPQYTPPGQPPAPQ